MNADLGKRASDDSSSAYQNKRRERVSGRKFFGYSKPDIEGPEMRLLFLPAVFGDVHDLVLEDEQIG